MKIQDSAAVIRAIPSPVERDTTAPRQTGTVAAPSGDGDSANLVSHQLAQSAARRTSLTTDFANISTERRAEIAARVSSGFYENPAAVQQTAEKMSAFYARQA
jgi:hypothetical protein